jgi:hypothetical protein
MYILRRELNMFGVELWWDGNKVLTCSSYKRKTYVLEEHEAHTLKTATVIMKDLEEAYYNSCSAMC